MVQYDVKRVTKGTENSMVSFDFVKTPITQVADYIIIAASKNKSSDIHFDPREDGMMVRFRIDGDCQDYTFIPKAYERNLTTRIKLLANMNITETRLPQDGAIKGQFGDTYLDMRVACLPTNQGEKIVIRILDYTRSLQGVDSLGFHPKNLEKIYHMMSVPNGIILVTGATGSGKSTTTYSMLSALNKPEINVITVEDPVEMNIEGINQVQVNAEIGMTFAAALRSILREDPNVILIGEIRDSETAQIAVRASITGHLVMSTLHTNNTLATVERLLDMDVERYLLSTALTGIISQRLAKQLCPNCRQQREATKYEQTVYKTFLHHDVSMLWDANPKGCDNCRKGYKGRLAVHEVLLLDDKIRNALNDENMSKEDFAKMIYSGNTISMLQDALIKVLEGKTSFEEVYKTIEIENEDADNYVKELEGIIINQPTEDKIEEEKPEEDFIEEDIINDNDSSNTENYDSVVLEIPYVNETSTEENNIEPQDNESDSKNVYIPEQEIKEENNLGYIVAMPNEENQSDNTLPTEEEKIQEQNNEFVEEQTVSESRTSQVNADEIVEQKEENEYTTETFQSPNSLLHLDNIIEDISDENANNATVEIDKEKYTISSTQNDKDIIHLENVSDNQNSIAPIVESEKKNDLEEENQENSEYQNTNTDYYGEDAIEPTTDIKTDLDELIIPNFKIERLDMDDQEIAVSEKLDDSPEQQSPTATEETPNIQAISVVSDVTDMSPTEEHTGSKILNEPGIRIADDGSINQSAEINAEPILPNYEDE